MYRILRTIKKFTIARVIIYRKVCIFLKTSNFGRYLVCVLHGYTIIGIIRWPLGPKPRRIITVNLGTEMNATKGMIENVIQP